VNGAAVSSGAASGPVALSVGSTTILTVVTAQAGNTETYTIVVTTVASAASTPSVSVATGGGGSAYDISIGNGAAAAATSSVMLSLWGTGAYTMELSNSSSFASSTWIPYATSMPWTLAAGTGEKTVFVQYRSISGSIVGSAQASVNLTTPSVPTAVSATSTTGMSASQLQDLLASLETQFQALRAKASGSATVAFTRNLSFGMTGNDVTQLQLFLISQASGSAAAKLAKHGTTDVFGNLTFNALVKFQKTVGIKPASGYFGSITRAWANAHQESGDKR
jgi:hypothetical protein